MRRDRLEAARLRHESIENCREEYFKPNLDIVTYARARDIEDVTTAEFGLGTDSQGRLVIPIHSWSGHRVIAYARRPITVNYSGPKYINSRESRSYSKSRTLYNFHRAMPEIRAVGVAVIVEGYFDVMTMWIHGVRNVVSCCGTSLTGLQLDFLSRHCRGVVLAFDGDGAGITATTRALGLLKKKSMDAYTMQFDGDPDSHLRSGKPMPEVIEQSKHDVPTVEELIESTSAILAADVTGLSLLATQTPGYATPGQTSSRP